MICYYKICVIFCLQAGDKSLADVVAHEIAHSWTGNLVTNKNPEHFW
jgi:leukotriene-A4 hydrolase